MVLKRDRKLVHTVDPIHTYSPDSNGAPSAMTESLAASLHHTGPCRSGCFLEIPAEGPNPSCSQGHGARLRLSTSSSRVIIPPILFLQGETFASLKAASVAPHCPPLDTSAVPSMQEKLGFPLRAGDVGPAPYSAPGSLLNKDRGAT